jgi:hypothetical protein
VSFDAKKTAGYQDELEHLDGQLILAIGVLEETLRTLKIDLPVYSASDAKRSRIMWRLHEGKMRILAPMKGDGKLVPIIDIPRWMRVDLIQRCLTDLFDAIAPTYEFEIIRTRRATATAGAIVQAIREQAEVATLSEKKR